MATNLERVTINLTEREIKVLRKDARAGESVSNLLRRKLGLKPLKHGGLRKPFDNRKSRI